MKNNSKLEKRSAIIYQSLYLMNLLLIPGIAFFILLWKFIKHKKETGWQRAHLYRSFQLAILSGFFLVVVPALTVLLGRDSEALLAMMLVYFVTTHAFFVLIGMFNVSRAMAKKPPLF